jgi:hypothetical protein
MDTYTLNSKTLSYEEAAREDRSAPRIRLSIPAHLRPSGVTGFSVSVTDLSLSGFACEATTGMPVGGRCWLTLPSLGALQAEVVWNDGIKVGCAFSDLLNQSILDAITNRYSVPGAGY